MPQKKLDVFISFQFSGIDPDKRADTLEKVKSKLQNKGKTFFCSNDWEELFKEKEMTNLEIYDFCLEQQRLCDSTLFIFMDERKSKGMQLELERAKALKQKADWQIHGDLNFTEWVKPFISYAEQNTQQ